MFSFFDTVKEFFAFSERPNGDAYAPLLEKENSKVVLRIEDLDYSNLDESFINTLPDHIQVWFRDFVIPSLKHDDDDSAIKIASINIHRFLTINRLLYSPESRASNVVNLFTYMSESYGTVLATIHTPKFAKVLREKIEELGADKMKPFEKCNEKTKKLLYAITGILY